MKLEKVWLYTSLFLLLVLGFSLINLTLFLEIRRQKEEELYRMAKLHFQLHLMNKNYRGDEDFLIDPKNPEGYRLYYFEEDSEPLRRVSVGVREGLFMEDINRIFKRLLLVEFFVIFTLVLLYQAVVEGYVKRLSEKEEWVRRLLLALIHRLGNFLATQRVVLALLRKKYPQEENLIRLEKSLSRAQRDFSLFMNMVRERQEPEEEQRVDLLIRETLKYFEEELASKKVFTRLSEFYARMRKSDLEDVLYNLIGNAIRHSKSKLYIKLCPRKRMLVIRNDLVSKVEHGMGLGVELTKRTLEKYNYRLTIRLKSHYTAFVLFRR